MSRSRMKNEIFSIHAEIACLYQVKTEILKVAKPIMIVIRVNSCGQFLNSKPCPSCQKKLEKYKMKIYHS